jgi:hypothetical protein
MSAGNDAIRRMMDGTSWEEFCDTLKAAGSVVLSEASPDDPFDRAEGWRYLTRLTRAALETFVEAADPQAPEFQRTAHETIKMGMDNPDNVYQSAPINGAYEYRLRGTRGTVHYLGFGTQAGNYGATGTLTTTGYLEAKDIELEPDGTFEILVTSRSEAKERARNVLPMAPESRTLVVRQTRLDHEKEEIAKLTIERIDGPNQPRHLAPERIDRALKNSAQFVLGCAKLFNSWSNDFKKHVNELPQFDPETARVAGGDPNIAYFHSYWELAPDEALVIEATPPDCDYWNFQVSNHWLESLDYRYYPIHVNNHTAKQRKDGSVRVILAHQRPEEASAIDPTDNWLETCGHTRGTMCWRWVRASEHPQPETRVVKTHELTRHV